MVSSLDHSVDRVVQGLKATGFYENTIIAFTTDNGWSELELELDIVSSSNFL